MTGHGKSQVEEFVSALLTASRVLVGVSAASLAEAEDTVTITQFRVLVVLEGSPDVTVQALAQRLAVTPSTAARTVDRLLAAELVTREENPSDRREVRVNLSAKGRELVAQVTARRRAALTRIVRRMPAAQRQDLVAALSAFSDAAGEPPAGGSEHSLGW
ncbi:MAG TPA: MarR family transcriptional regulator [Jatrophihabitans sp.]